MFLYKDIHRCHLFIRFGTPKRRLGRIHGYPAEVGDGKRKARVLLKSSLERWLAYRALENRSGLRFMKLGERESENPLPIAGEWPTYRRLEPSAQPEVEKSTETLRSSYGLPPENVITMERSGHASGLLCASGSIELISGASSIISG